MAFEVQRFSITADEIVRLRLPVLGRGGLQDLLRRLQSRLRGSELDVYISDFPRIARYWASGKGGFQRRFPIESLRAHLPSVAPLFADDIDKALLAKRAVWIYFAVERFGEGQIKIGQTGDRHTKQRGAGRRTDNPRTFDVVLWLAPQDGIEDKHYHRKFSRYRIWADREFFWPAEELKAFIREKSAEQELSQQRSRDDAADARLRDRGAVAAQRRDARTLRRNGRVCGRTGELWAGGMVRD